MDNGFYLACAVDGTGTFNQTGGVATAERVVVNARGGSGGNGTFTVAGGTFNIGSGGIVNDGTGPAAVNLGGLGGTIRATAGWSSSLAMTLSGTDAVAVTFDTNGNAITLSGVLGGAGGLNKNGVGDLTLSNFNTYTGGTTVNGGTLLLGAGGSTGTVRGTLTVNSDGGVDYIVANAFGYTAGQSVNVLNINGGTVGGADVGNHFWNNFQLNMTGGTLYLGGTLNEFHNTTITVNSSSTTAQILGVTTAAQFRMRDGTPAVFNVADGPQAVDLLLDANITQNGNSTLTKTGLGTMAIGGAGTIDIYGIEVAQGALSSSRSIGMNSTGRRLSVASGASLTAPGVSATWQPGLFHIDGAASLGNASFTINQTFAISGAGTLNVSSFRLANYTTANFTMTGTMTDAGTFYLGDASGQPGHFNQTGGTVNVAGQIRVAHWPNETSTYNISAGTLNSSGGLYVGWDGTGNMNVSGTADVNATAGTFVQRSSTLTIGGNATFDTNFMSIGDQRGAGTVVQNGGTVTVSGDHVRIAHWPAGTGSQYNITAGTLNANSGLFVGWDGTGAMNVSGSADVNATAGTFVQRSSTLTIGGNATFDGNYLYSGYDRGAGTTVFAGNSVSTFGGSLLLRSGGTVEIKDSASVTASQVFQGTAGAGQWGTINQSGGTLTLTSTDGTRILTIGEYPGATSYYNLSGGTVTALNGSGRAYIGWDGGGELNITGGLAMFKNLRADGQGGLLTLNGGELRLGSGGIDNPSGPVTINLGGGTLSSYESWSSAVAMNLTGIGGNVTIAPPSGNTITLNGVLGGSGGFSKTAAGTLTLTNNNTYSGNTDVQAGTLALVNAASNNNIPNSAVVRVAGGAVLNVTGLAGAADLVLASGQTLKGNGTVVGNLTAGTGSHVAPGDSPGILTVNGNVTMNAGSFFDVEIEGPTPGIGPGHYDQLVVNGLVNLNDATLNLIFGYPVAVGQTFTIISNDGFADLVNGTFAGLLEGSYVASGPGSLASSLQITYRGNDGNDVVLTGVPEPSSLVLIVLGLAGLGVMAARRRLWCRRPACG